MQFTPFLILVRKLLKAFTKDLAAEKNRLDEFALYQNVERLAPEVISKLIRDRKVLGQTLTSTAVSYIQCLDFLTDFTLQCLLPPEWPAGVHTY